jgi:hypothetical protein
VSRSNVGFRDCSGTLVLRNWGAAGTGPFGSDLAGIVGDSALFGEAVSVEPSEQLVIAEYCAGLRAEHNVTSYADVRAGYALGVASWLMRRGAELAARQQLKAGASSARFSTPVDLMGSRFASLAERLADVALSTG